MAFVEYDRRTQSDVGLDHEPIEGVSTGVVRLWQAGYSVSLLFTDRRDGPWTTVGPQSQVLKSQQGNFFGQLY